MDKAHLNCNAGMRFILFVIAAGNILKIYFLINIGIICASK
jgi:hypothetical protein